MNPLLPWQQENWHHLNQYREHNRVPQALLITGRKGLGKRLLADHFAFSLLCSYLDSEGFACGCCQSCLLLKSGTHPDMIRIEPAEPGKTIGVDQIRALIESIQLKPQYDAYRVVVIDPADQMNKSSFNAFLKCLEEPTERSIILLITEKTSSLPATIISRCQKLVCDAPANSDVHRWLKQQNIKEDLEILTGMAQNSPLLAKRYAEEHTLAIRNDCLKTWVEIAEQKENPIMAAENWLKWPQHSVLLWLSTWLVDLIRCFYCAKTTHLYNPDYLPLLKEFAGRLDLKGIYKLYDLILISRQRLDTPINKQLMFEEILIAWSELNRS